MVERLTGPVGVEVHQDPDTARHGTVTASSRAQMSGTSPRPSERAAVAREHRGDVVGGGEKDADEVVVSDPVSLEHGADERPDPRL